ncbi:MAG: hypothetical protein V4478_03715 [Patescibacteria group bacterium]
MKDKSTEGEKVAGICVIAMLIFNNVKKTREQKEIKISMMLSRLHDLRKDTHPEVIPAVDKAIEKLRRYMTMLGVIA